jgi:hypothetical protein
LKMLINYTPHMVGPATHRFYFVHAQPHVAGQPNFASFCGGVATAEEDECSFSVIIFMHPFLCSTCPPFCLPLICDGSYILINTLISYMSCRWKSKSTNTGSQQKKNPVTLLLSPIIIRCHSADLELTEHIAVRVSAGCRC